MRAIARACGAGPTPAAVEYRSHQGMGVSADIGGDGGRRVMVPYLLDPKAAEAAIAIAEGKVEESNIVHMHEKVERPEMLLGSTYKIKTPLSEHSLYVTINDIILNAGTEDQKRALLPPRDSVSPGCVACRPERGPRPQPCWGCRGT